MFFAKIFINKLHSFSLLMLGTNQENVLLSKQMIFQIIQSTNDLYNYFEVRMSLIILLQEHFLHCL